MQQAVSMLSASVLKRCLTLSLLSILCIDHAYAAPKRAATAGAFAAAGVASLFFANARNPDDDRVYAMAGATALTSALMIHGRILPAYANEIRARPLCAAVCALYTAGFFALRASNDPNFMNAGRTSSYVAGGSGMVRYLTNRGWGSVREFYIEPDQVPRFPQIATVWFANQATGIWFDLTSTAFMSSMALTALSVIPGLEQDAANFYDGYYSLGEYTIAQYAVTLAGSATSAICATGVTYLLPWAAGSPAGRLPCHLARLAARMGARYALKWHVSGDKENWQEEFWRKERWEIPFDIGTAFIRHRWWESTAEAYMRDLGVLGYDEYDPQIVRIHGVIRDIDLDQNANP